MVTPPSGRRRHGDVREDKAISLAFKPNVLLGRGVENHEFAVVGAGDGGKVSEEGELQERHQTYV